MMLAVPAVERHGAPQRDGGLLFRMEKGAVEVCMGERFEQDPPSPVQSS